jgi:hypothetical protein
MLFLQWLCAAVVPPWSGHARHQPANSDEFGLFVRDPDAAESNPLFPQNHLWWDSESQVRQCETATRMKLEFAMQVVRKIERRRALRQRNHARLRREREVLLQVCIRRQRRDDTRRGRLGIVATNRCRSSAD